MKMSDMLAGGKYKVTYRLGGQRYDREMVAVFVASDADDHRKPGPVMYVFSGRPWFGTATLSAATIAGVEQVDREEVCYPPRRAATGRGGDRVAVLPPPAVPDLELGTVVNIRALIELAGGLLTEDDSNPEYDRALVELVTDAAGLPSDSHDLVARYIRAVRSRELAVELGPPVGLPVSIRGSISGLAAHRLV